MLKKWFEYNFVTTAKFPRLTDTEHLKNEIFYNSIMYNKKHFQSDEET